MVDDLVAAIPLCVFESDFGIVAVHIASPRDEKLRMIIEQADHDQVGGKLMEQASQQGRQGRVRLCGVRRVTVAGPGVLRPFAITGISSGRRLELAVFSRLPYTSSICDGGLLLICQRHLLTHGVVEV
jgi:hypothetical protein